MTSSAQGLNGRSASRTERGRFSSRRKSEAVLRLLRGEELDALSRELGVTAATLSQWRERLLAAGRASLTSRPADERDEEIHRLQAKVGEITMANELLLQRAHQLEAGLPFGTPEVEVMSRTTSPSTGRPYGTTRICQLWEVPRSTVYERRARARRPLRPAAKRGPRQAWTDEALTEQVRAVLAASPFTGEGYRKVWARLRLAGVRTSKGRVLRLMREAGLLAPTRVGRRRGPRVHDGTITTERPDEMWGTDATSCLTTREGNATVFIAVDHCTQECIGIHAARPGTRFEALEPLRQGLREHFDGYEADLARGLALRHDHGSQYLSDHFQEELRFLGIRSSPSFVARARGQRLRGTLHPHAEGAAAVGGALRDGGGATPGAARLQAALQPALARRNGTATAPQPPSARRSRRAPGRPHDYRQRCVQETRSGTWLRHPGRSVWSRLPSSR